jgi:hypothetical protein
MEWNEHAVLAPIHETAQAWVPSAASIDRHRTAGSSWVIVLLERSRPASPVASQVAMTPTTPSLSACPLRILEKLGHADTDRQGNVDNAVFSTMLETGRVESPCAAALRVQ